MYFSTILTNKNVRFVWRGIKTNLRPKILPRRDRTPGFEIPGSAPICIITMNKFSLEKRCAPVHLYFKYKHWEHYDTATSIVINIDLRSPWYLEYEKLPLDKTIPRGVLYFSPSPSFVYKSPMLFIFVLDRINHGTCTITPTMELKGSRIYHQS